MTEREAALLLCNGWAERPTPETFRVLDPFTQEWHVTDALETATLLVVLDLYPTIARIWEATVDRREGHRGWCASLVVPHCTCGYGRLAPVPDDPPVPPR